MKELVIRFKFAILDGTIQDSNTIEYIVSGRGKTVADCRRDARRQMTRVKKNLRVIEIPNE